MEQAKKKILLIEDEFYIRDLYRGILAGAGWDVFYAADGVTGLEQALQKPDLILLDIMLPQMNGIEVLKKLKSQDTTKQIPVVLLTNLGQSDIIKEAFDDGAQGYLLKVNLKPAELIKQTQSFLDDPQRRMDFNTLIFD